MPIPSKILKFSAAAVGLLLVILVLAGVYLYQQAQPIDVHDSAVKRVVIPKGASVAKIADILYQKRLIKNSRVFEWWARWQQQKGTQFQAGSFELSPSMSFADISLALTEGTDDIWVTLPEGLRREEIAQSLAQYDLEAYDSEEFISQTVGLEGKLFPETYLVPRMIETQAVINLMTQTFDRKIDDQLLAQIEQAEATFNEVLTMASILEREARGYEQMQLVSGVLWKRLELGMPLQADATLQYANGYDAVNQSWWSPPTAEDKKIDSPFNTYQNPGLPPRPICNPGLDAIKAAVNPTANNYLYYLHDNQGEIHFAASLDEHNQNVNTYLR